MSFGLELAALVALPFAAAIGVGSALAALDVATGRNLGWWLTLLLAIAMIPATFFFLTQIWETDFKTEIFALAPLMAMVGLFIGHGLGKVRRGISDNPHAKRGHSRSDRL